jgi:hypothetical protein
VSLMAESWRKETTQAAWRKAAQTWRSIERVRIAVSECCAGSDVSVCNVWIWETVSTG